MKTSAVTRNASVEASDLDVIERVPPAEVWTRLTERQQQAIFQALVRLCCQLSPDTGPDEAAAQRPHGLAEMWEVANDRP